MTVGQSPSLGKPPVYLVEQTPAEWTGTRHTQHGMLERFTEDRCIMPLSKRLADEFIRGCAQRAPGGAGLGIGILQSVNFYEAKRETLERRGPVVGHGYSVKEYAGIDTRAGRELERTRPRRHFTTEIPPETHRRRANRAMCLVARSQTIVYNTPKPATLHAFAAAWGAPLAAFWASVRLQQGAVIASDCAAL